MSLKQTLEAFEALDSARASGRTVVQVLPGLAAAPGARQTGGRPMSAYRYQ